MDLLQHKSPQLFGDECTHIGYEESQQLLMSGVHRDKALQWGAKRYQRGVVKNIIIIITIIITITIKLQS